jgi:hypothetical protein
VCGEEIVRLIAGDGPGVEKVGDGLEVEEEGEEEESKK